LAGARETEATVFYNLSRGARLSQLFAVVAAFSRLGGDDLRTVAFFNSGLVGVGRSLAKRIAAGPHGGGGMYNLVAAVLLAGYVARAEALLGERIAPRELPPYEEPAPDTLRASALSDAFRINVSFVGLA
jgi:hypothetical protein